jgi:REP element-mobilizing transposase RayT
VTRRCSERRFFLRPSALTNQIFLYVLAVAAQKHQIFIHAACVMSNHYHLIVTDPDARLPAFVQYLDGLVARATNALLGRRGGLWDSTVSFSAVSNETTVDIVRKTAYALANPVAAGLVRDGREWPGVRTAVEQLGTATLVVQRPKVFFGEDGDMPESAEFALSVAPGFSSSLQFREAVAAELHSVEERTRRDMGARERKFLGVARVLAQDPFSSPADREPWRCVSPRVAAIDKWKRLEALSRIARFVHEYRAALSALKAGIRDVVFPAGTYLMRIAHGVRCAASG